ncbi:hypothetical protein [Flavobacterium soyae]|uniref:Uncharacterized protein n=1 Tax=Flavobacterium soyae TaxID=2903098 RepID=A0ABZ2UHE5_9FLAO
MIKKGNVLKFLALAILLTAIGFWANYLSGNEAFYKRHSRIVKKNHIQAL